MIARIFSAFKKILADFCGHKFSLDFLKTILFLEL